MSRSEYISAEGSRQGDTLQKFERAANSLIESDVFSSFLAHCELMRLDETDDFSLMESDEGQEILSDVISRLDEYRNSTIHERRCDGCCKTE